MIIVFDLPYILTYKSQNLRQNLDLKVVHCPSVGGDLYAGHKIKNFFPAAKIRSFRHVAPRDSVLLCDVVPLRRGTRHRPRTAQRDGSLRYRFAIADYYQR